MTVETKPSRKMKKEKIMKKRLFSKIAALAMAAVLALGSVNISPKAEDSYLTRTPIPEVYTYEYKPEQGENPLYAATKFHIFAQESASLSAHCNGNMATPLMYHNVNSGSNMVYTDISGTEITYIGKLGPNFNGTFAATTDTNIVFGRGTEIKLMNGVDCFATDVNGNYSKVNTKPDLIYKEGSKDYINFEKEFENLNKLSLNLASEESTATFNENVVSMPNSNTGTLYINADSSKFMNRAFIVENCDFKNGQALVINVNVGTATTYELPFTQVLFKDTAGKDFGTGEDKGKDYTGMGNVLWNFYGTDANGNKVPFTGTLKTCTEFKGTVLAPSATITTANSNQDGNFIGKVVKLGSGETHRWDFGGKLKNYAPTGTVTVVVKDDEGNPISDAIIKVTDTDKNAYDLETDDKGVTTTLNNLPLDKYTATLTIPEGYELVAFETNTKSATITEDKPDATIEFVIKKEKVAPETGYFHITVTDQETGALVPNVDVTITKAGSDTVVESLNTGINGKVDSSKMDLPTDENAAWDKYDISITIPDGYMMADDYSQKVTDELTDANPDKVEFVIVKKPIPTGAIQIEVVAINAGSDVERAVEGAKVTVKDNASHIVKEVTVITDDDGLTPVVDKLELAKYTTTIDESTIPEGFKLKTGEDVTKNVTVEKENEVYKVKYVLVQEAGSLVAKVTDENGKAVSGVTVEVFDNNNKSVGEFKTDNTGLTDELYNLLADDKYTAKIIAVPEGYEAVTSEGTKKIVDDKLVQIDLSVKKLPDEVKTGDIKVTVTDMDGIPVKGVTVKITDDAGNPVGTTGSTYNTDDNGLAAEITKLPAGNKYIAEVTGVPEGYVISTNVENTKGSNTIVADDCVEIVLKVQKEPGDLIVTITDANNGKPIPGATVIVKNDETGYSKEVTTNSEGKFTIEDLHPGEYDIITKDVPGDYDKKDWPKDTTATVVSGGITQKDLKVPSEEAQNNKGNLQVTIRDKYSNDPIEGATVVITSKTDPDFKKEVTTNNEGQVELKDLTPGDYVITTTEVPKGYTAPDKEEKEVIAEQTAVVELIVFKPGSIDVTIIDKDTKKPIPDTKVEIIDKDTNEVVKEVETDKNGNVEVDGMEPGDYIIHVPDVPGYDEPQDKTVTVEPDKTTIEKLEVEKDETTPDDQAGGLDITIIDRNTQDPIPDAKVEIIDKTTNEVVKEVTTDKNGNVVVDKLNPGDYTIHVVDTPQYAEPKDEPAKVEPGKTTEKTLVVDKVGQMQITIADKNDPTKPIPGATVVVKDKDGNVIAKLETNDNGQTDIVKDLIIGETFTIETVTVPEGYTPPTPTTQKITKPELEIVKLEVGRDSGITSSVGSLYVIITDKNTGAPIPGATVEVSNSKGETVKTVVTDNTGSFTVTELKPDTYTVTTTKVPEGYTAPDAQSAAVKTNARTDVHLYVAKSATKDPTPGTSTNTDQVVQTGDESNVQAVSILAVLACLGIIVVSIMRKREENLI